MTIQNELVNRLIDAINPKYINMFDIEKMKEYNFVPISMKDEYLFVAIDSNSDKAFIASYIHEILKYEIKYIQIPDKDFTEIINYILNNEKLNSDDTLGKLDGFSYFFQVLLWEVLLYAVWHAKHTITFSILCSTFLIIVCTIKRLNDINASRRFAIFALIPGVKYAFEICLSLVPATYNKNKENRNILIREVIYIG